MWRFFYGSATLQRVLVIHIHYMRISIQATGITLTDALQSQLEKRCAELQRITRSFEDGEELLLRVEIARATRHHKKGEEVYYVEYSISIRKKIIRIEQHESDLRRAIDMAQQRMKSALVEYKDRLKEKGV